MADSSVVWAPSTPLPMGASVRFKVSVRAVSYSASSSFSRSSSRKSYTNNCQRMSRVARGRAMSYGVVGLLPDADRFIVRACDEKFAIVAHCKRPNLSMMSRQFLDILKLTKPVTPRQRENIRWLPSSALRTYLISIPIFHHLILPHRPEVMAVLFTLKGNLHHALLVRK